MSRKRKISPPHSTPSSFPPHWFIILNIFSVKIESNITFLLYTLLCNLSLFLNRTAYYKIISAKYLGTLIYISVSFF